MFLPFLESPRTLEGIGDCLFGNVYGLQGRVVPVFNMSGISSEVGFLRKLFSALSLRRLNLNQNKANRLQSINRKSTSFEISRQ